MAITKLWAIKSDLSAVNSYISNPEKTSIDFSQFEELHSEKVSSVEEKVVLVRGINCSPSHVIPQFTLVKEHYGKRGGIQAYHGCISFKEADVTPKETIDIASEFVKKIWGDDYQILIACHNNTKHLHCHFLINSVSFTTGLKLQDNYWFKFRHIADEICKKYGKDVIEKPELKGKNKYGRKLTLREQKAKECLDFALESSNSYPEFLSKMALQPCSFDFSLHIQYWKITPNGWKVPVLLNTLGQEYEKENILLRFPDADNAYERFIKPSVFTEYNGFVGVQKQVLKAVNRSIEDSKREDDNFPDKVFVPRLVKQNALSVVSAIKDMTINDIETAEQIQSRIRYLNSLLRILQEKKIRKLGTLEENSLNVSINECLDLIKAYNTAMQVIISDTKVSEKVIEAPDITKKPVFTDTKKKGEKNGKKIPEIGGGKI